MSTGEEAVSLCNTSKLFLNNIAESESMQLKKASETLKSKCLFLSLAWICNFGGQLRCGDCCVTISPENHFWNLFFCPQSSFASFPVASATSGPSMSVSVHHCHIQAFEGTLSNFTFCITKDVRTRFSPLKGRSCQVPKGTVENSAYVAGSRREVQGLLFWSMLSSVLCNALLRIFSELWCLGAGSSSFSPFTFYHVASWLKLVISRGCCSANLSCWYSV